MTMLTDTVRSLVKIALLSRRADRRPKKREGRVIVMGNGPSLNDTITAHEATIKNTPSMSVNFAPLADVFFRLQPEYHVLADPHFFSYCVNADDNRSKLLEALSKVSWPMTLFVPLKFKKAAAGLYSNPKIDIRGFNAVGIEGSPFLTHKAFSLGLGMPRPRNVLIPAIMLAMGEGFDEIIITGADHSWMKTIAVTDDNEVVSVQPHFYAESKTEEARVRHEYKSYRLHEIVGSFAVAFKSYHDIARYAATRGIRILNATPGSFIDAFERTRL